MGNYRIHYLKAYFKDPRECLRVFDTLSGRIEIFSDDKDENAIIFPFKESYMVFQETTEEALCWLEIVNKDGHHRAKLDTEERKYLKVGKVFLGENTFLDLRNMVLQLPDMICFSGEKQINQLISDIPTQLRSTTIPDSGDYRIIDNLIHRVVIYCSSVSGFLGYLAGIVVALLNRGLADCSEEAYTWWLVRLDMG